MVPVTANTPVSSFSENGLLEITEAILYDTWEFMVWKKIWDGILAVLIYFVCVYIRLVIVIWIHSQ